MEAINHVRGKEGNVFACYLDVRKAFDSIDGMVYKLFSELGVNGKMFAKCPVYKCSVFRIFQCVVHPGLSSLYPL